MEQNIKFDNNDLLIPCALLPRGEKGEIGCQTTQDLSTTSTNPIDHNTPQQEIAEPPAELIPENQDPQQNNYLGANFNCADPEEPAAHSNKFVSHPPMSNNSKVALLFQMAKRTNLSFLRVFRKEKRILELLEWMKKWWKLVVWNLQWPQ